MNNKMELLSKIIEWAMPYSPFSDNSLENIKKEMVATAQMLDNDAINLLVDIGMSEHTKTEDFRYMYEEFLYVYLQFHNNEKIHNFISKNICQKNAYPMLVMIGYTRNPEFYSLLVDKIDFFSLSLENKFQFLNAISNLENLDAINYLKKIQSIETNTEVIDDIEICIDRLLL